MYQCLKCGNSKLFCNNSEKCKYINSKKMQHMFSVDNLLDNAFSNTLNNHKIKVNQFNCTQCKYCRKIFENDTYLMYHLYYNCEILSIPISRY